MKIVAFDEIYNSVVKVFPFEVIFVVKLSMYYPDLSFISRSQFSIYVKKNCNFFHELGWR
jgi:hypothetical protein